MIQNILFYKVNFLFDFKIFNFILIIIIINCYVTGALKKIEETASHINDHVSQYENVESMLSIAKRLTGSPLDIVEPGRKIIKQGSLMKVNLT